MKFNQTFDITRRYSTQTDDLPNKLTCVVIYIGVANCLLNKKRFWTEFGQSVRGEALAAAGTLVHRGTPCWLRTAEVSRFLYDSRSLCLVYFHLLHFYSVTFLSSNLSTCLFCWLFLTSSSQVFHICSNSMWFLSSLCSFLYFIVIVFSAASFLRPLFFLYTCALFLTDCWKQEKESLFA